MDKQLQRISSPEDLITTREETRAGFIHFALEKNRRSTPYIDNARALHDMASHAENPMELLSIQEIRTPMLTASGLSDKALHYLTDDDKTEAIKELIKNFLEPAGAHFVDELVYRYLLIKGDSLGGVMRNLVGMIAEQKLIRALLANLSLQDLDYYWLDNRNQNQWIHKQKDDFNIEANMRALSWENKKGKRILAFNLTIPLVGKNVDLCLYQAELSEYNRGKIVKHPEKTIMLGELKGGIDPAGADEHWKTANTALERIRTAYTKNHYTIFTSFIGAAIEASMAREIYEQLEKNILSKAINLTKTKQLNDFCNWLLSL